jgi:hypothetical protein
VVVVEPADAKKEPKSSEAVVNNGLEVVVTPTQLEFPVGQAPTLKITYTNRGEKEFALHSINHAVVESYRCVDTKTGDIWQAGPWQYFRTPIPETAFVMPGKAEVRTESLRGPYKLLNGKQPSEPRTELPAGTYQVTAHIVFELPRAQSGDPRCPFWTGEFTTKAVEVVVVEKAKDGK